MLSFRFFRRWGFTGRVDFCCKQDKSAIQPTRKWAGFGVLIATGYFCGTPVAQAQDRAQDLPNGRHSELRSIDPADPKQGEIDSPEAWERRRASIRRNLERVMGPLPQREGLAPVAVRVLEQKELASGTMRQHIEIDVATLDQRLKAETEWVRAYLFLPKASRKEVQPAILCLHQTVPIGKEEPAGMGGSANLHYALELAERGYVTLAPDYPSFGEYRFGFSTQPQWASGSMKAIWNNMRCLDLLQQLPQVHGQKLGCIGHSLGGHNTIFTSFFDERVSVAVSSCGFTRFHKYYGGNLKGWTSDRYMPRIATEYQNDPDRVPFDFPELIAGIAPRGFLTSSPIRDDNFEVTGVKDSIAQAVKIYRLMQAEDRLQAIYPDSAHDFPPDAREQAYGFIDSVLRPTR
jgi:dienelactone hydrolase